MTQFKGRERALVSTDFAPIAPSDETTHACHFQVDLSVYPQCSMLENHIGGLKFFLLFSNWLFGNFEQRAGRLGHMDSAFAWHDRDRENVPPLRRKECSLWLAGRVSR